VCKLFKLTKLPFDKSTSMSQNYFDLKHSDVWRPAPLDSYNHFKYFVTFIDDYSHTIWLYLLKIKDEVSMHFQKNYNFIENQYDAKIKIFRSDNGMKYVNKKISDLFKEKGILDQKYVLILHNKIKFQKKIDIF
jgi:Integrase core domain